MYKQVSNSIEISVTPEYLAEQSIPEEYYHVWADKLTLFQSGGAYYACPPHKLVPTNLFDIPVALTYVKSKFDTRDLVNQRKGHP